MDGLWQLLAEELRRGWIAAWPSTSNILFRDMMATGLEHTELFCRRLFRNVHRSGRIPGVQLPSAFD